ncbi:hypothetical protein GCM10020331_014140 [Ectobacillus funiculus]
MGFCTWRRLIPVGMNAVMVRHLKTPWMNEVVYQIASFMALRPATPWRWSHARHHTDTIIVGSDPEIIAPRPPVWKILLMELAHLYGGPQSLIRVIIHCFGKLDPEENEYIPESERQKNILGISDMGTHFFAAVIAACISMGSILPAMFIILPTFFMAVCLPFAQVFRSIWD